MPPTKTDPTSHSKFRSNLSKILDVAVDESYPRKTLSEKLHYRFPVTMQRISRFIYSIYRRIQKFLIP